MLRISNVQNHLSISKQQINAKLKPHLKQVYQKYLHSYETRSDQEIKETTQIIKRLSSQNLARLNENKKSQQDIFSHQKVNDVMFICIHGLPPFSNEFQFLNLPPKSAFYIISTGFQYDSNSEDRIKSIPFCTFSVQADKINKIFQQNPNKEVIFIYHSFGTYLLSTYFQKYGRSRVKGLIELGAAPIRQYRYFSQMVNFTLSITHHDLIQKTDQILEKKFKQFVAKINNQLNVNWVHFPQNSYGACFLAYFKSPECPVMFDLNRRYPNVLKLMIFGEDDPLFQNDLVTERAYFYSKQKLQKQKELAQNFNNKKQCENNVQNIQNKFIFMIPKGKHSVHMQKKNKQIISKAVNQYLSLILK